VVAALGLQVSALGAKADSALEIATRALNRPTFFNQIEPEPEPEPNPEPEPDPEPEPEPGEGEEAE